MINCLVRISPAVRLNLDTGGLRNQVHWVVLGKSLEKESAYREDVVGSGIFFFHMAGMIENIEGMGFLWSFG